MRGRWPCTTDDRPGSFVALLVLLLLAVNADAISYRCENNQVLVVQSFGNDTIRMHCQRLHLCGYEKLECGYDHEQASCGGKLNFVAHVNQATATGPVQHTCCELKLPNEKQNVPGHDGNDCFVYELPDGTSSNKSKSKSVSDDITVLKSANQIPEQFEGGYVGYRMRLFMLKNKSPPTLIVKAIERVSTGYRVTICRPRCGKFSREGEISQNVPNEEVVPSHSEPAQGKSTEQWTAIKEGPEYQALQWGSWSSSTWETWKTTEWTEEDDKKAAASGTRLRSSRVRTDNRDKNDESPLATASASASANSGSDTQSGATGATDQQQKNVVPKKDDDLNDGNKTPQHVINNVNVRVKGGRGGQGGHASINLSAQSKGDGYDRGLGEEGPWSGDKAKNARPAGHDYGNSNNLKPVNEGGEDSSSSFESGSRHSGGKIYRGRPHRLLHTAKPEHQHGDGDGDDDDDGSKHNNQLPGKHHRFSNVNGDDSAPADDAEGSDEFSDLGAADKGSKKLVRGDRPKGKGYGKSKKHGNDGDDDDDALDNSSVGGSDEKDGSHSSRNSGRKNANKHGPSKDGVDDGHGDVVNDSDELVSDEENIENDEDRGRGKKSKKKDGEDAEEDGNNKKGKNKDKKPDGTGKKNPNSKHGKADAGKKKVSNNKSGKKPPNSAGKTRSKVANDLNAGSKKLGEASSEGVDESKAKRLGDKDANKSVGNFDGASNANGKADFDANSGDGLQGKNKNGDGDEAGADDSNKKAEQDEGGALDGAGDDKNAAKSSVADEGDKDGDGDEGADDKNKNGKDGDANAKEDGKTGDEDGDGKDSNAEAKNSANGGDNDAKTGDLSNAGSGNDGDNSANTKDKDKSKGDLKEGDADSDALKPADLSAEKNGAGDAGDLNPDDDGDNKEASKGDENLSKKDGDDANEGDQKADKEGDDDGSRDDNNNVNNGDGENANKGDGDNAQTGDSGQADKGEANQEGENAGAGTKEAHPDNEITFPNQQVETGLGTPDSDEDDDDDKTDGSGVGDGDECDGVVVGVDGSGDGSGEGSGEEYNKQKKCSRSNSKKSEKLEAKVERQGSFVQERTLPKLAINRQSQIADDDSGLQWQDSSVKAPAPSCFSGDTQVETAHGPKLMRDLQVGDYVLVPAAGNTMRYEQIAMFYHREPETRVKFVRLVTEQGKVLALTALHLLPFGNCTQMQQSNFESDSVDDWMRKARFAHKAQIGDCVLTLDDKRNVQVERVVKIGREYSKGIYSPMTVEGSIITNNILVSCFSQIESHAAQKMAFDVLMMFYSAFGYLSGMAYNAVQEIPILLNYFHQFSWYLLPFAKY